MKTTITNVQTAPCVTPSYSTVMAPILVFLLMPIIAYPQNVELDGGLKLLGDSESTISNAIVPGREILQLRSVTRAFGHESDGSGLNLYGDNDLIHPGAVLFFTGGSPALEIFDDQNLLLYKYQDFVADGRIAVRQGEAFSLGHRDTMDGSFIPGITMNSAGDLVLDRLKLTGNSSSIIQNSPWGGRQVLEMRAVSDAFGPGTNGSGLNLYGDGDTVHPGSALFLTGGEAALEIFDDQRTMLYGEQDFYEQGRIAVPEGQVLRLGHRDTTNGSFITGLKMNASGDLELDRLRLYGNSSSLIQNSEFTNREILEIRAISDAFEPGSNGSGINLYGDGDHVHPGAALFMTGGNVAVEIKNNQVVEIQNEIQFVGDTSQNARVQKNSVAGRDELQLYSTLDAYSDNSKGAGIHVYGNDDFKHAGNIAFLTGNNNEGDGRMIIAGGGGKVTDRNLTDTRVTIGNDIWNYVDDKKDKALLTLKNPIGRPALYITDASASEGDIAVTTGQQFNLGHFNGSTFTNRFEMDANGHFDIDGRVQLGVSTTFAGELNINANGRPAILSQASGSEGDLVCPDGEALQFGHWNLSSNTFTERMSFRSNGDFQVEGAAYKPGGGTWSALSDFRLKTNIREFDDGLEQVLAINPVIFNYNEKSGLPVQIDHIGVIAQELKEVAPYMVGQTNMDGEKYLDVDNSAMIYMLINAVKEQQQLINSLQDQIDGLTAGEK